MPVVADPIVTLPEAKGQLNLSGDDQDTPLTAFVAAASQMIVNRIGPVAGSPTVEEWHDGGSTSIMLRDPGPIQSVTTVTESAGPIVYTLNQVELDAASSDQYAFTVDLDAGLLVRRAAGVAVPFMPGVRNVHVTFVAGYATVPPDIKQATLLLLQHMWETQRGPSARPSRGPVMEAGQAYALPNRVMEILAPYMTPGIA